MRWGRAQVGYKLKPDGINTAIADLKNNYDTETVRPMRVSMQESRG